MNIPQTHDPHPGGAVAKIRKPPLTIHHHAPGLESEGHEGREGAYRTFRAHIPRHVGDVVDYGLSLVGDEQEIPDLVGGGKRVFFRVIQVFVDAQVPVAVRVR
jgi:hypothetical protein